MQKNLSDRISERVMKNKNSTNSQSRAIFLALRLDIEQAIKDGWSIKNIWETLKEEGKVNFSYESFRLYINALIRSPKNLQMTTESQNKTTESETQSQKPETKKRVTEIINPLPMPGFTYNSIPNTEELF